MTEQDDPLWDPARPSDPELDRLASLLSQHSAAARGLSTRLPRIPRPARRRRWPLAVAASVLLCCIAAYLAHGIRLHWDSDRAWAVRSADQAVQQLAPGEVLETGSVQRAEVSVARIGRLWLSPDSRLGLVATAAGRHRVRLDHGHLRARIWAPPGFFGVQSGAAEVIDLGCDFDLWVDADRSGRVVVRSGWIVYRLGAHERLVPAAHVLSFDARRPGTPLREDASEVFREQVGHFDRLLAAGSPDPVVLSTLSNRLAQSARDEDAFTLLSLLSQRPELADGALYPRLAAALGATADDLMHRRQWAAGEAAPRAAWWALLPTQPKQWWRNWRDLFP